MGRHELLHRKNALARGYDDYDLARMRRRRQLHRVRPGVYTTQAIASGSSGDADRRIAEIRAALAKITRPAVVSHASAALIHGLALWDVDRSLVHMTRPGSGGGHTSSRRRLHTAPLADEDVTHIGGIPVTSVARTVVDLARTESFTRAVAVGDSALNNALTNADELRAALGRCSGRTGCRHARGVLESLDERSESPGESWTRIQLQREGLPRPELQRVIRHDGIRLGRVDFYFGTEGIVGEFDGKRKYADPELNDGDPSEVVWEEKQREDRLRARGLEVVRWVWDDLRTSGALRSGLEEARARAERTPPPRIDPPCPTDAYRPRCRIRPFG